MDTDFTVTQKRALAVATVLAVGFGAYFLRGQFMLVVVAGSWPTCSPRCSGGSRRG